MSEGQPDPFADNNPYRATEFEASTDVAEAGSAEAIRREHIKHEASVKSIGTLFMLGFALLVVVGIFLVGAAFTGPLQAQKFGALGIGAFYLLIGGLQGFTAYGLWKLQTWARWIAVTLSVMGLIGFPIGTLFSAYFLYLLLSQKGAMVFSDHYQEIIAQTPHIHYKTPIIVWILLFVLIALVVFGLGTTLVGF